MSGKVRKQFHIESDQAVLLKLLAQETGISEAGIVRQAIDRHIRGMRHVDNGMDVWEEERAFIRQRMAQGPVSRQGTCRRVDLHVR